VSKALDLSSYVLAKVEAKAETDSSSDRKLPLWAVAEQTWAWTGGRV